MEDNEFDATLRKLSDQVSQFTGTVANPRNQNNGFLSRMNLTSPLIYYGAIPLVVLVILLIWKPRFVTEEVSVDGNLPERRVTFKRAIVATILVTSIIAILIFVRSYRGSVEKQTQLS